MSEDLFDPTVYYGPYEDPSIKRPNVEVHRRTKIHKSQDFLKYQTHIVTAREL